ncbi:PREDICTED: uncharacterized protein LOC109150021 [Ipomoea nil]|uniref:uncharacterized protein LOC109150021 n=1 Tax=Ipomoea nil TaxID=35883 RepID=UPI000900D587|nr:PREDICTED: uncharacterized protein LOC109150021 [Ipomoea nil]
MVSEPWRATYAAAVSSNGESQPANPVRAPSMNPPPVAAVLQSVSQRNQLEDMENPFYLNVNENPNSVLVSPPLVGSVNYGSWSISMQVALEVKNKWSLVDGSIETPDRDRIHYGAWKRCNLMIKAWILKAIHPSIAQSVMYMETAKDVWNDMRKLFSQRDPHRISILQNEIYGLKQGNLSVNEYYTKSKSLWEEMNELRPLPICKCNPHCSCNLIDEVRKDREVDQIIRFLQGLIEDYNSLKSNVLVLDPLPEMHKIFVMAEKFERQLNITNPSLEINYANAVQNNQATTEEIVAMVNQYNSKKNMNHNGGNKNAKCTFCRMMGHTIEKCYKKHGYPPRWIPGFKSRGQSQSQNPSSMTAVVSLVPKFDKAESHNEGNYSLNSHIYSVNLCASTWILDSGATDHIVCSREFFDDYHIIEGAMVNLPNGEAITVQHKGNIKLADGIWLQNALHIPEFKFNIVSVSKLLQNSSYSLIFDYGQCLLRNLGKTTVFANEDKGLYLLLQPPEINHCKHFVL